MPRGKQKKSTRLAIAAVVAVVAVGALTAGAVKFGPGIAYNMSHPAYIAPEGAPVTAFLGDSYVEGSLRDSGPRSQWADLVSKTQEWEQHDFASGGSGFLTRGKDDSLFFERIPAISKLDPDIVVVSGGLNDPAAGFDAAAGAALTTLRSELPDAAIYVLSNFAPGGSPTADDLAKRDSLSVAASAIDATFIDVLDLFAGHSDLIGSDGEHPTDDGHKYIADQVLARL